MTYEAEGFCQRNRDAILPDLLRLVQSSTDTFLVSLFPDDIDAKDKHGRKKKEPTASGKIKKQANILVNKLMECQPHYIRTIKPNETKKAHDWDKQRCSHQVLYLGLKENVRVRRAGFAFRRVFDKFLRRYNILTPETYPTWRGTPRDGVLHLMDAVQMEKDQYQLGQTKVFIKNPESLFLLEELRERKYDKYARTIQKHYRRWKAQQYYEKLKEQASDILFGKKERRRGTINRNFMGDYIGYGENPALRAIVGKKDRCEFAYTVKKFDRRFKEQKRDLMLTSKAVLIIGREKMKKGPTKGQFVEVVKRSIKIQDISHISLSSKQDGFIVIHVPKEYDSLLEIVFKTEFLTLLAGKYKAMTAQNLDIKIADRIEFQVKKEGWGGGKVQSIEFSHGADWGTKPSGKKLLVTVPKGLPSDTRPATNHGVSTTKSRGVSKALGALQGGGAPRQAAAAAPAQQSYTPPAPVEQSYTPPAPVQQGAPAGIGAVMAARSAASQAQESPTPSRRAPGPPGGKPKPKPKPKPKIPQARALYDYEAQDVDELNLKTGDIVSLTKKDPSGWWQGRLKGKEGLFPGVSSCACTRGSLAR